MLSANGDLLSGPITTSLCSKSRSCKDTQRMRLAMQPATLRSPSAPSWSVRWSTSPTQPGWRTFASGRPICAWVYIRWLKPQWQVMGRQPRRKRPETQLLAGRRAIANHAPNPLRPTAPAQAVVLRAKPHHQLNRPGQCNWISRRWTFYRHRLQAIDELSNASPTAVQLKVAHKRPRH